jgi:hypothetical protein
MAEIPRRNVHVFSSNGVEVAGEFDESLLSLLRVHQIPILSGFFQHGGVSISTFIGWINEVCYFPSELALYPCQFNNNCAVTDAALDSGSEDELQPGRYVIRTPPPGKVLHLPFAPAADRVVIESAQIIVYLTTDVPRTRVYSVNYTVTYTPHVRFQQPFTRICEIADNSVRKQIS